MNERVFAHVESDPRQRSKEEACVFVTEKLRKLIEGLRDESIPFDQVEVNGSLQSFDREEIPDLVPVSRADVLYAALRGEIEKLQTEYTGHYEQYYLGMVLDRIDAHRKKKQIDFQLSSDALQAPTVKEILSLLKEAEEEIDK